MRHSILWPLFALVAMYGCSGADEHPLGGPYGGTGAVPSPSRGTSNPGADGGVDPAVDGDAGVNPNPNPTPGHDAGSAPPHDSGTTPPHDSGTPPPPGIDAGTPPPPPPPPPPPAAPTWTSIYASYFASGTAGNCAHCHSGMSSASRSYTWLTNQGYPPSTLTNKQTSCLSWYSGNMPPSGPSSFPAAAADLSAWTAAGAQNN